MKSCKNPKCGEFLPHDAVLPVCVSCRLAGRWGAGLALGAWFAIKLAVLWLG